MTVSVLHTGRHYPDELSDEGLIYHYPQTDRSGGRDVGEARSNEGRERAWDSRLCHLEGR